jgi:hypothetical protein
MTRPELEFSRLHGADVHGFKLTGSGVGTVQTPRFYRPGRRFRVTVRGVRSTLRADKQGRLTVRVPLGPVNPAQQDSPGATTRTFTTRVTISRAGKG